MDLAELLANKRTLVVAGEGAPLAAAMCAWIFEAAGLEPGFSLRAPVRGLGAALRPASSRRRLLGAAAPPAPFVVEGARAASAEGALLVGDADAAELGAVVGAVEAAGLVACAAVAPGARLLAAGRERVAFFAVDGDATGDATPTWLGALVPVDAASGAQPFDLFAGGSYCGRFALRVAGADAVRAAVGAVAICAEGFGVDVEKARQALASFEGGAG